MFTLWLTGPPAAGKSTLARLLEQRIARSGRRIEVLDGDEVRHALSPDLGFSPGDRDLNVRRLGFLAALLTRHDVIAIVAAVSPYEAPRRAARSMQTGAFIEVLVDCDIGELRRRDPKGLYRRSDRGDVHDLTGVDAPYESPTSPDVHLRTDRQTEDECVDAILAVLRLRGLFDEAAPGQETPS